MSYENWVTAHARVGARVHAQTNLDDLMSFFHQLATLVAAGTPLLQATKIAADQNESKKLRDILEDIVARLASGQSFYAAASCYPKTFDHSWLEMIHTGELTGKMSFVLQELNKQIHETRETRKKIKGAMMYPIILLCVATLAISAMLRFVIPTFSKMFREMGADLPPITQFVVNGSDFVVQNGLYILGGLIAVVIGFRKVLASDKGRRYVLGFLLVVPMVGDLMVQATMYRFSASIALLLKSGVPMLETLETLRGIFGKNPVYRDALGRVQGRVAAGQALAVSLEDTGLFTSMIVNTVRIGEESGQLASVMEQIAPYYKERMETLIARVSKLLEPVIIIGMGTAVAVMMLSIYLPMFDMSGKVK